MTNQLINVYTFYAKSPKKNKYFLPLPACELLLYYYNTIPI